MTCTILFAAARSRSGCVNVPKMLRAKRIRFDWSLTSSLTITSERLTRGIAWARRTRSCVSSWMRRSRKRQAFSRRLRVRAWSRRRLSAYRCIPRSQRKDIVNMFLEAYPGRFDLTERAWRSLDNCESSPEVLWNALYYICTLLHSLWRSGSGVDFGAKL